MASNTIQIASSPIPAQKPRWIYDVFLSFRGEDTRKNFTDRLYTFLTQKGIFTFRDDEKLEKGKGISPSLLKAIEESRFSIIILSRNYANSSWCLDELLKILECKKLYGQTVLPVFYDVDVSDVMEQTGRFGEAFTKHEEVFKDNKERVQRWRVAFVEVANLPQRYLLDSDRCETEIIQDIAKEISSNLSKEFSNVAEYLVGMDSRIQEMNLYLAVELDDVRIIGICGMEGIGKTTIARAVYDKISSQFEGTSFLADIREASKRCDLVRLQEQLLSEILMERNMNIWDVNRGINAMRRLRHKRILLVLDDVDQVEQLESLAGMHDWFGVGSRIIITTRDENLLIRHGVDRIYKPEVLNHDEALKLFCWKAFKKEHPVEEYVNLSNSVVDYANGVPLALKVLGSFLFGRRVSEWKSALKRLEDVPNTWKSLK